MVAYSFQGRFIDPIKAGLGVKIVNERGQTPIPGPHPKLQTIRAIGKRRHARPGEELQLYYAQRSPRCMLIGKSRCTEIKPVKLYIGPDSLGVDIDGDYFCGSTPTSEFAQADGFADVPDMLAFWTAEHPNVREFVGLLIKWEPLQ